MSPSGFSNDSCVTDAPAAAVNDAQQTLLTLMVQRCQLSAMDAEALAGEIASGAARIASEEDALQWLAREYGLGYTALERIEPDRALLGRFSARILLKEELLPLSEKDGMVEVAVSRLFATPGLDSLRALTTLR